MRVPTSEADVHATDPMSTPLSHLTPYARRKLQENILLSKKYAIVSVDEDVIVVRYSGACGNAEGSDPDSVRLTPWPVWNRGERMIKLMTDSKGMTRLQCSCLDWVDMG